MDIYLNNEWVCFNIYEDFNRKFVFYLNLAKHFRETEGEYKIYLKKPSEKHTRLAVTRIFERELGDEHRKHFESRYSQ